MPVRSLSPAVLQALNELSTVFQGYTRGTLGADGEAFWTPDEPAWIERASIWELPEDLVEFVGVNVVTLSGGAAAVPG